MGRLKNIAVIGGLASAAFLVRRKVRSHRIASQQVFLTPGGGKYHHKLCQHVTDEAVAIPLSAAREEYEPCSICSPPL